jgi:hypothetical protein
MVAKAHASIPVQAPTFTRLLARLAGEAVPASDDGLTGILDQWIEWNRAVVLARALDQRPAQAEPAPEPQTSAQACLALREELAEGIRSERGLDLDAIQRGDTGFAPYRAYYLASQRAILAACGRLRGTLRDQVAATSPGLAHLAAVDAVMEQILSPREHQLLGRVVDVLQAHYQRLHPATDASADAAAQALFRRDLQDVLLGELDLRFQPIHALCEALRNPPIESR